MEARQMRLGAPLFATINDPDRWVAELRRLGYGAAYCPLEASADDATIAAYRAAADRAGIVIAEVGAWSNPLSPDSETRRAALSHCQAQLALADRIGARCCVNIAGSLGSKWDGPFADDLSESAFDLIVETVRAIIDAVRPTRTYYALETMPWMYPDSAESYTRLLHAVDRRQFAVHFDAANLINSPERLFNSGAVIRQFCHDLGPLIRSCHLKDVAMEDRFMVHINEVRPGLGCLDYRALLTELAQLDPDLPLMLEHLPDADSYSQAAAYVRAQAAACNLTWRT
jgi:sugar phosphate isomerase/epimerase